MQKKKMTKSEKMILEGLEARYGTDVISNAIMAMVAPEDTKFAPEVVEDEECVSVISVKEAILNFIKFLEGSHIRIKELHWSADHQSKHKLADDLHSKLCEIEDEIAEDMMGYLGTRITIGEVTPIMPKSTDLKDLIEEIEECALNLEASVENDRKMKGVVSIIDDLVHELNKSKYLETMK